MPKTTLHDLITRIEAQEDLDKAFQELNSTISKLRQEPDDQELSSEQKKYVESQKEELTQLKKRAFEAYKIVNPILTQALKGEKTIEKALEEVDNQVKGISFFLPGRKKKYANHNQKVNHLSELLDNSDVYKKEGIFLGSDIVSWGIALAGSALGVCLLVPPIYEAVHQTSPEEYQQMCDFVYYQMTPIFTGLGMLWAGLSQFFKHKCKGYAKQEAQYLDKKIEKLF